LLNQVKVLLMIPVRQKDGADVDVILGLARAIDDHGPEQTTSVLSRVVRVIPRGTVKISDELVSERLAGWDRALADRWDTVLPRMALLENAMPVKGCALRRISDIIAKSDLDGVSPVGLDQRAGKLIIDEKDITLVAIGGDDTATDGEVVVPNDTGIRVRLVEVGVVVQLAPRETIGHGVVLQELRKQWSEESTPK
jgi:hypothetical protein